MTPYVYIRFLRKAAVRWHYGAVETFAADHEDYYPRDIAIEACLKGDAIIRDDSEAGRSAEREVKLIQRIQHDVATRRAMWAQEGRMAA